MLKKDFLSKLILIFVMMLFSVTSYADQIDNLYNDLKDINKSRNIARKSYTDIGQKFYKIYQSNPTGKHADRALLGAARTYKDSYKRYRIEEDYTKSTSMYRRLQSNFSSQAGRTAYIEVANLFLVKKDKTSAKYVLNSLLKKYPTSKEASKAKTMLASIGTPNQSAITRPSKEVEDNKPKYAESSATNKSALSVNEDRNIVKASIQTSGNTSSNKLTNISTIRYFSDKDYTRIVVDLTNNARYEGHWLRADPAINKPARLMLDVFNSTVSPNVRSQINVSDSLVSSIRFGYHDKEKRTRIVLDSKNIKDFSIFQMSNPSRIVIDVYGYDRKTEKPTIVTTSKKPTTSNTSIAENNINFQNTKPKDFPKDLTLGAALGLKIRTIVIDPGHGGKDPGAIYNNLREKDVVLEISKYLYEYLKADKDLQIHLTRSTDIFIPLEERTAIANKLKADIFVSIHANAAKNPNASGIETFVFNVTNDRAALEVAALENQATTKSISDLQGILKDILKYSKLEESVSLAGSVQGKLIKNVNASNKQNLGVKQAPFYVLVGARMPAILIETGFITNANDAKNLKSSAYRKKIALGIYQGIKEYISKYNN